MREPGLLPSEVTTILLLLFSLFTHAADAFGLPRATKGNGFLSIPVRESRRDTSGLVRRDAIEAVLTNQQFFYTMDIEIGTPGQLITVLLDTGSSDLWVNPNCSATSSSTQRVQCHSFGHYDPDASTTPAHGPLGHKTIRFGDPSDPNTQSKVEIDYYADDIAIFAGNSTDANGGTPLVVIANQTFGVVVESHGQAQGILGLAPDLNAGFDGKQVEQPYSLLLNSLVEQGHITKRVFSLDLRHADAAEGAVIYGGLDRGKFIGDLVPVPLVDGMRGEPRLAVKIVAVTTKVPGADPFRQPLLDGSRNAMLDSGTTLSRLHANAANTIFRLLGARSLASGYWLAPCALRSTPIARGYVDFDFGNKTLRVPLGDFILDLNPSPLAASASGSFTSYSDDDDGEDGEDGEEDNDWCYVGLVPTADQQVLGDSILRAGYFVFDWDEQVVHIAQASNCGADVVPITKNVSIDSISGDCEADWAVDDGDSSPSGGHGGSGGDDDPNASPTDHRNNSSRGTDAADAADPSATQDDADSPAGSLLSRWRGGWFDTRHIHCLVSVITAVLVI